MQQREVPNKKQNNGFIRCADLILPWLYPRELAAVSLTCKTLTLISESISFQRSLDASRSVENISVPFHNTVDRCPYAYFIYSPCQVLSSPSPPRQSWGSYPESDSENASARTDPTGVIDSKSVGQLGLLRSSLDDKQRDNAWGCWCERCEEEEDDETSVDNASCCPCRLGLKDMGIMNECGPGCECGSDCPNRVTQRGISVRLKIVRDVRKGWGLYADQVINKGQFVCEYAGELLTTKEAQRRQKIYDKLVSSDDTQFASALLVVREHLPSGQACLRINIDATQVGNIARFINHSCDGGNLSTALVRSSGTLLPRLCFFASRDIEQEEELSFSYGDFRVRSNGLKCFCGSSCCFGTLPSEET